MKRRQAMLESCLRSCHSTLYAGHHRFLGASCFAEFAIGNIVRRVLHMIREENLDEEEIVPSTANAATKSQVRLTLTRLAF